MKRRRGFTLIELLVVVAIIALLMAILLPSLARAKEQARITACASNHKQIMIALNMYNSENAQKMPISYVETHALYGQVTAFALHPGANFLADGFGRGLLF